MAEGDVTGNADSDAVQLPAALDLAAAEGLLALLRERLKPGQPLRLDASTVETLTTACAQILLSAAINGHDFAIENPSANFTGALEDLAIDLSSFIRAPAADAEFPPAKMPLSESAASAEVAPPQQSPENQSTDGNPIESAMAKRILTIDDSKTMRDMLMLTLAEAGFDVVQAVDGQDGLDVLGKEENVDVIITDINICAEIRNTRRRPFSCSPPRANSPKRTWRAKSAPRAGWSSRSIRIAWLRPCVTSPREVAGELQVWQALIN